MNELSDEEVFGRQSDELSDDQVFGSQQQSQQPQQEQIPQAFIDRLRQGRDLQDTIKKRVGDRSKDIPGVDVPGYEGALAAAGSLVNLLVVKPLIAHLELGAKASKGELFDDPAESLGQAFEATQLGMFRTTQFSRVTAQGVQRIGTIPKTEDFQTAASVLAPEGGFTAFHGSPNEFGQFRGTTDVTTDQGFAERYRQPRGEPTQFGKDRPSGFLYQVNVRAKMDDFLNLDRPLTAQSEQVKAALDKAGITIDERSGADVWDALRDANGAESVARAMREAGIAGTSREHGVYSVFDPGILGITHKNGRAIAEDNLRDLWDERGIHPAEAVHDADRDAFLKADLTHPNPEPLDRSGIAPPTNSPIPKGAVRTELAKTGDPLIDAILDEPIMRQVINNPVVDDTHTIGNSLGGSVPVDNPVLYRDKRFPKTLTVDGVTFDTADPSAVHENVEEFVIDLLMKGTKEPPVAPGMVRMYHGGDPQDFKGPLWFSSSRKYAQGYREDASLWYTDIPENHPIIEPEYPEQSVKQGFTFNRELPEELAKNRKILAMDQATALKVAFWHFGEPAEDAWYRSHGIDPVRAEEQYPAILDEIALSKHDDIPADLFRGTYPDSDPTKAGPGPIDKPTAEEVARAREIISRAIESGELRPAVGGAEQMMARATSGPEKVVAAAIRFHGKIYQANVHVTALQRAAEANGKDVGELIDIINREAGKQEATQDLNGFVTSTGRYVSREEAKVIADRAEQLHETAAKENKQNLSMEDLKLDERPGFGRPAIPAGAAVTPPHLLPPLSVQPPPRAGSLVAAIKDAGAKLFDVGRNIQMLTTPMVRGSQEAQAIAKDFANAMRRNRWEWQRIDQNVVNDPGLKAARARTGETAAEQRERMWNAADEESTALQTGASTAHQGLATLEPEERAVVEDLQLRSQLVWAHARNLDMVEGDGLPAYTPRMIYNVATAGGDQRALPLNSIGLNLRTRTAQMLHREYMYPWETEAAAKARLGPEAVLARDIRALPLATAKLEDAIAGRTLINAIEDAGKQTGSQTVSVGSKPDKEWFTIDHPAFKRWTPDLEQNPITGKWAARTDDAGNVIFKQVPIYIRGDFEGPLRSVLTVPSGKAYGALMSLKGKTMGLIMNSPLIHNAVEWGRALPAMPGKVATFRVYFDGNRAKSNPVVMQEAIEAGLVPIGKRFFNQDITSIMEEPNLAPGRSWTAQVLGFIPDLFDQAAGDAVKSAIDKAGDFWHNTLLWDRVGDLQMGLYTNFRDGLQAKGVDRLTASRAAAHWANRYAGALPQEAMSDNARKISNLLLFSRSFTLGNIGAMKDMLTGLPKDVMAQIERDGGMLDPKAVKSIAVRKAIAVVTLDMGLMYVGNSLLQNGMNVLTQDSTIDKEMRGYAERLKGELEAVKEHPLKLLQPLSVIQSLSATSENEPNRDERIRVGYASDGTAIYARNPAGKIGEEFSGYLSGPLDMLHRKLGTIAKPIWQIMANDKGFGRKVYDPNADIPAKYLANMGAIAAHLAASQLPEGQIGAFMDLVKGDGDPKVNALQAFGPVAGVTFAKGAPGGPAVGEMYQARAMHDYAVQAQLPDIRKQIQRGDVEGARDRMTELGIAPGLQRFYIRTSQDPATRLNGRTLRDFYLYGTPEQKQRLENARELRPQY